ncbi:MAG: sulfite exporter TauE/SafE family protein [Pseudomonadota bacterium]|nr:sulfite exporter TauE/SafE family protein [Pseudomonadota bacterium]
MTPLFAGALAASLLGSPHCVGMCGPFVSATGPAWHAGRLLTYVALGALAGAAGMVSAFIDGNVAAVVSAVLLAWFAARLAGWAPSSSVRAPWLSKLGSRLLRRGGIAAHLGFGVVSGLLPCGLVWSALALAVPAGSALGGAGVMTVFWLGTLPALSVASVALRRLTSARPWARRAVAAAVLATGLVSIGMRGNMTTSDSTGAAPSCHTVESP